MNLNVEIERRIQTFVTELSSLVRRAALESVNDALGGDGSSRSSRPAVRASKTSDAARPPLSRPKKGQKRDPEDLSKLVDAVGAHVEQHPGEGVEAIAKRFGVGTKELALPIKKLLAAKAIRKTGQKRATRYFPRR